MLRSWRKAATWRVLVGALELVVVMQVGAVSAAVGLDPVWWTRGHAAC